MSPHWMEWSEVDEVEEAKRIAARNALGISAEDEARFLSEDAEYEAREEETMENKEKTADRTEVQPTVCPPHTSAKFVKSVWTCTRCGEPIDTRPTRTFSSY